MALLQKTEFCQGLYNPVLSEMYLTLLIWNNETQGRDNRKGPGLLSGVLILNIYNEIKFLLLSRATNLKVNKL